MRCVYGFEAQVVGLEELAQLAEVFDDEVGPGSAELFEGVVASQHRAGMNAAMSGSLDVVLHVADKERGPGFEVVFLEDFMDLPPLVPHGDIAPVKVLPEAGDGRLHGEMVAVDGAEQEGAQGAAAAEFQEIPRVGEFANRILDLAEVAMEPKLECGKGMSGTCRS